MSYDPTVLKYKTSKCTDDCKAYCGYCIQHAKAECDHYGDWVVGNQDQERLYISTVSSKYVSLNKWHNEQGLTFGRSHGPRSTSMPFGYVGQEYGHYCIAGTSKVTFGVKMGIHIVGVGGRVYRY